MPVIWQKNSSQSGGSRQRGHWQWWLNQIFKDSEAHHEEDAIEVHGEVLNSFATLVIDFRMQINLS